MLHAFIPSNAIVSSQCIYICRSLCVVLIAEGPPKLMSVVLMSLDDGMFGLSLQYDVKVLTYTLNSYLLVLIDPWLVFSEKHLC